MFSVEFADVYFDVQAHKRQQTWILPASCEKLARYRAELMMALAFYNAVDKREVY